MALVRQPGFYYLPILDAQRRWGLYLTDCGYTVIPPGSPYPPRRHPDAYQLDWERGRVLAEYQVVYLTRGSGVFETRSSGLQKVGAGDVLLLYPGIWHRYAPDPGTGWDEHWIGFGGPLAARFLGTPFFNRKKPVLHIGVDERLRQHFVRLVDDIGLAPVDTPFSSAGRILQILGLLREHSLNAGAEGLSGVIREAKNRILQEAAGPLDFQVLARSLGVGYSSFRHRFKEQTGLSPAQFQQLIRLNQARDLLASTTLSISEVAARCGYETVSYFSRAFKEKAGRTPTDYRALGQRKLPQAKL